jgi:hypothetical protein
LKILEFLAPKTFKTFKTFKNGVLRAREGRFRRRFLILKSRRGQKRYRCADGFAAPAGQRAVAHKAAWTMLRVAHNSTSPPQQQKGF